MPGGSLLYGASVLTLTGLTTQLIGFIYRILLSRAVGAEAMGIYHLVISAYSVMLSVCLSGLTTASLRLSAGMYALGRKARCARLIKKLLSIFFLLSAGCAVMVFGFSGFISENILNDSRTRLGLVLLIPVMLLTGVENVFKTHFLGIGRVIPGALSDVGEIAVRMMAVFAVLTLAKPDNIAVTVACIVIGMGVSEVFSSSVLFMTYRKTAVRAEEVRGQKDPLNKQIFRTAVPVALTNFASNLLSSANSVMIPARMALTGMAKSDAVALLGTMFGMSLPMITFPMAFIDGLAGAIVPSLSEGMAKGDIGAVRRKISKAFLGVSLFAIPSAALMIPVGPDIARLLFGSEAAGNYMTPLCFCVSVLELRSISSIILTSIGRESRAALHFITGGAVQTAFTWFGTTIPGVGVYAIIAGLAASGLVTLILNINCIVSTTGLRVRFVSWFVCPCVAALPAELLAAFIYADVSGTLSLPFAVLVSVLPAIALYILLIRAMGIKHTELFFLRKEEGMKKRLAINNGPKP